MVGMAYAAVPLYEMFCQVTGYGGTTQRVEQASDAILDRKITVTLRRQHRPRPALGLRAGPARRSTMKIGETVQVKLRARRTCSTTPTTGQAVFNVTPEAAGAYFNKVECFCFTDTTLKPGETLEMPVVFFVDPEIVDAPRLEGHQHDHPVLHLLPDASRRSRLPPDGKTDEADNEL